VGGFKSEAVNVAFDNGVISIIIAHLIKCSKKMKADCIVDNNPLINHEDRVTDRLIAKYLNAEPDNFRYEPQSPENFNEDTDHYIGRTDIKVISRDYFNVSAQAYFVIECKRIDGSNDLNKKYITEGVARFVCHPTKYSSYYKQNIMFGYVVRALDISDNAGQIDKLQSYLLKEVMATNLVLKQNDDPQYCIYVCEYVSTHIGRIELSHLFFNFADAIS